MTEVEWAYMRASVGGKLTWQRLDRPGNIYAQPSSSEVQRWKCSEGSMSSMSGKGESSGGKSRFWTFRNG
jgi:hypothetical protein